MLKHSITKDGRIILKNFSYLSLMRLFNIGFKFLIIAYLIRVIGEKNYGLITWLDSIIQYFLMIINFGFNIYAAKYIVDYKDDKKKLDEIVSSIYILKGILLIGSVLCILLISNFNDFIEYRKLLILFILIGVGEVLFPIWYFQGKENLKPATLIVFLSRLILVICILIFITTEEDIVTYIVLSVLSSFIMGLFGLFYIIKNYQIKLKLIPLEKLWYYFKESFPFFLGRFLSLVFNFGTIFLIGKYCLLEQVAGFDLSIKIVMVAVIPFDMLQQAVFPTLARTLNKIMLKKLIFASIIFGTLLGILFYFLADQFILLLGGETMTIFTPTLQVLSMLIPFIALTFILGSCGLVAFGWYKEYNRSLISTSIIYLIILILLYYFDLVSFWNLIYLRVFGDVLMCAIRTYYLIDRKVLVL